MENARLFTRPGMQWFLFMLIAVMFFFTAISEAQVNKNNLVFILDASGSMWGQVEGTAKIIIAKDVLTGLINDLPQDLNVDGVPLQL